MRPIVRMLAALYALIIGAFRLAITPIKTIPEPGAAEFDGALPNIGSLVALQMSMKTNGAPAFGNFDVTNINPDLAAATYTGQQLLAGLIRRQLTTGAATTDSTDSATNIVNALPGATVGQTFITMICNLSSATLTVAGGTGVTMTGTAAIERFTTRLFLGKVLGSAAVTMTNVVEFGGAGANNL